MVGVKDKVVAITGAGSGIGQATARELARRGARIALAGRDAERLDVMRMEIEAAGGEAIAVAADVTRSGDLAELVDSACTRWGRLDVLVSNAGIGPVSRFDALRLEDWNAMIDVNLKGVLHGIAAALPVFRRQEHGHFVNVVSTAGLKIVPGQGVYAATKNAVRTITEALRQEAGPKLRVTGVSPGFVQTGFVQTIEDLGMRETLQKRMDELAIPPAAIARAIAFAIEQPDDVEVGDIVIRPTAQD